MDVTPAHPALGQDLVFTLPGARRVWDRPGAPRRIKEGALTRIGRGCICLTRATEAVLGIGAIVRVIESDQILDLSCRWSGCFRQGQGSLIKEILDIAACECLRKMRN